MTCYLPLRSDQHNSLLLCSFRKPREDSKCARGTSLTTFQQLSISNKQQRLTLSSSSSPHLASRTFQSSWIRSTAINFPAAAPVFAAIRKPSRLSSHYPCLPPAILLPCFVLVRPSSPPSCRSSSAHPTIVPESCWCY